MNALVVRNVDVVIVETPTSAIEFRDQLLAEARDITAVSDQFLLNVAADIIKGLRSLIQGVEKTRQEVKAPFLKLTREIDSRAGAFVSTPEIELKRINGLITAYTNEQRIKAQQEREADQRRLEQEKREAQRAEENRIAAQQRLEEEKRKAEEAAATAFTAEESQQAQSALSQIEEQRKAQEEAERKTREQIQQIEQKQAQASVMPPAPVKPRGLVEKKVWRFEVTDVHAIYDHDRSLVRVDPNVWAINDKIRQGLRECPGLKIWCEETTEVRR